MGDPPGPDLVTMGTTGVTAGRPGLPGREAAVLGAGRRAHPGLGRPVGALTQAVVDMVT